MRGIVLDKFEIKEQGGIGHIYITKEVAEITKECWNELLGALQYGVVMRFESGFNRDCLKDTFIYSEGNKFGVLLGGVNNTIASLFECDYIGDYEGVYSRWLTDMKRGLVDLMEFEGEDDYLWAKSQSQLCVRVRKVEKGSKYKVLSDKGIKEEIIESNLLVKMTILRNVLLSTVRSLDIMLRDKRVSSFLQNDRCMYELVSGVFEKASVRLRDTVSLERLHEWKGYWRFCSDITLYVSHVYIVTVLEKIQEVHGSAFRLEHKQKLDSLRELLGKAFDSRCELKTEYKEAKYGKYSEVVDSQGFEFESRWYLEFIISAWQDYSESIYTSVGWEECEYSDFVRQ